MSESDFHFGLKGNVEALYCGLKKRKEFYITVQNLTDSYMPQVKVSLTGPPEVKILIKENFMGGLQSEIAVIDSFRYYLKKMVSLL